MSQLADFSFHLPDELIAQRPAPHRGESRLMQIHTEGPATIGPFSDILDAFRGDELLIVNDSRVVPARIFGQKPTGGRVEMLVIRPMAPSEEGLIIEAMLKGKNLKPGLEIQLPGGAVGRFTARHADGTAEVILRGVEDLWGWLHDHGQIPLPPYIERTPDEEDVRRYQTVYARDPGSVAAPTAGLHFTEAILQGLRGKGVAIQPVTLHVGLGTFMPIRVDDLDAHEMHGERYTVPQATADALAAARAAGRPIVCAGTTAIRAIESFARSPAPDTVQETRLFIRPGFDFAYVDGLITNFHLPESTLLMLVCALAGTERVLAAYRAAVEARMMFYSYGDASLMRREDGRWT